MELYGKYLAETGLKRLLEKEWGFATYHLLSKECYIDDIYVLPDRRHTGDAVLLADEIAAIAKQSGCTYLTGSVNTRIKNPTASIKSLLFYGFKFLRSDQNMLWFVKEL